MNTVPQMISTKDLSYIEDMANWTCTLSKKAYHFAGEVSDTALKDDFNDLAVKLRTHYQMLLSVLQSGGNNESK